MDNYFKNKLLTMAFGALIAGGMLQQAHAGGFSLYGEVNGKNAGDFAATGAVMDDASAVYYNPATLVNINSEQVTLGGTAVLVSGKYTGTQSLVTPGGVLLSGPSAANGIQGGQNKVVPNLFYAKSLGPNSTFGVGLFVPFGLATDWGKYNATRYLATKSELEVIDLSPALAARITEKVSIGMGLDIQYMRVELNQAIPNPFVVPSMATDMLSTNIGHSTGFGAHGGLLFEPDNKTKVGLNYQSMVIHKVTGRSQSTNLLTNTVLGGGDTLSTEDINLPAQTTLSVERKVNNTFAVKGTAAFVQWKVFNRIEANGINIFGTVVNVPLVIPENFRNTWRVAGAVDYNVNDKLTLKIGGGIDQSPINNIDRNLRIPDEYRKALAIGAHYQADKTLGLDIGYTHLFVKDAILNNSHNVGNLYNVVSLGRAKGHADLIGGQVTWTIA